VAWPNPRPEVACTAQASRRDTVHSVRGHHAHGSRGGAAGDDWLILVAGLGWQRKLEGVLGCEPGKVARREAHPSGVSIARGRSSGRRLCSLMLDVEAVAGGDPDEVLWLRGRYTVIRHEPIEREKRTGRSSPMTGEGIDFLAEFRQGGASSELKGDRRGRW
jgi:hypothetical protein